MVFPQQTGLNESRMTGTGKSQLHVLTSTFGIPISFTTEHVFKPTNRTKRQDNHC